ncbi:hypothetical protein [Streptomyces hundungensis]|uniref:hypothetical protein n=1 Tax=Streptomyces hundungensis TaxID=1077946 RepID=UPI0033DE0B5D
MLSGVGLAGAGSVGGGLAMWALPSGRQTPVTTGRTGTDLVAFGPDGKTIATCTDTAELLAAVQVRPVA